MNVMFDGCSYLLLEDLKAGDFFVWYFEIPRVDFIYLILYGIDKDNTKMIAEVWKSNSIERPLVVRPFSDFNKNNQVIKVKLDARVSFVQAQENVEKAQEKTLSSMP